MSFKLQQCHHAQRLVQCVEWHATCCFSAASLYASTSSIGLQWSCLSPRVQITFFEVTDPLATLNCTILVDSEDGTW